MKKRLGLLLSVLMACLVMGVSVYAAEQNVVRVNNIDAMVGAIASNTKIVIEQGNYIAPRMYNEYGEESGIRIQNIENLTIEAEGPVEIKLQTGFCPVFDVRDSKDINFIGLSLGHDVPEYDCIGEGDVISLQTCENVVIDKCDLWGCGIIGIIAFQSGNINVTNTVIRDCHTAAVNLYYMTGDTVFDNCEFLRNTYTVRDYNDEEYAKWTACIQGYANEGQSSNIKIMNSAFKDNYSRNCYILENINIEFINCTHENNGWSAIENTGAITEDTNEQDKIGVSVAGSGETEYSPVEFPDQEPVIVDGRTLVPVRGLFENSFFNCTVEWDEETRTAIISNGIDVIEIPIGVNVIYKNNESITIDVPAQIINDRTMLPLRAISEAFGLIVEWDEETRTVLINEQ